MPGRACGGCRREVSWACSRRTAAGPFPENVREELRTWERKLESVALRTNCCLVECASAAQADTLARGLPDSRRIGEAVCASAARAPKTHGVGLRICWWQRRNWIMRNRCRHVSNRRTVSRLRASWGEWNLLLKRRLEEIGDVTVDRKGDLRLRLVREKAGDGQRLGVGGGTVGGLCQRTVGVRVTGGSYARGAGRRVRRVHRRPRCSGCDDAELCDAVLELPDAAALLEGRLGLYTVMVRKGALSETQADAARVRGWRETGERR